MSPNGVTTNSAPPIPDPTVKIGARTFALRYNFLAEFLLSNWGFDFNTIQRNFLAPTNDPKFPAQAIAFFAACVGHEFAAEVPPRSPLTPEQWAIYLPVETQPELLVQIGNACKAAFVKWWEARKKQTAAPMPPTEMPAAPTPVQ